LSARNEVSIEQGRDDVVSNLLIVDGELDLTNTHVVFLTAMSTFWIISCWSRFARYASWLTISLSGSFDAGGVS
jgi:hypothetical protein